MLLIPLLLLLTLIPGPDRCAQIRVEPTATTVSPGSWVGLIVTVGNCGDKRIRVEVETEVISACGEVTETHDGYDRLAAGQGSFVNRPYQVPENGCLGTYYVKSTALIGNTVPLDANGNPAIATAEFEVVE